MPNKRVRLTISGRVQGVGFRANTRRQANQLNLTGWVRNLANGDVEVVAEGEETTITRFIGWAKQGPRLARVADFQKNFEDYKGEFDSFSIRY